MTKQCLSVFTQQIDIYIRTSLLGHSVSKLFSKRLKYETVLCPSAFSFVIGRVKDNLFI